MKNRFELPVGSHADMKELEYLSALHQSAEEFRDNGTIEAEDVSLLLMSRLGVQVEDLEVVEKEILVDLAGEPNKEARKFMDIRQLASMLLIPHLAKLQANASDEVTGSSTSGIKDDGLEHNNHIERVFQALCADLPRSSSTQKIVLTPELVRQLLQMYSLDGNGNQVEVSETLVNDMLQAAGGEGVEFNQETFRRALTHDLSGYNTTWETSLSTGYDDILSANHRHATTNKTDDQVPNIEEPEAPQQLQGKAHKIVTLSELDNVAENYGSQPFSVLLWLGFLSVFVAYVYSQDETRSMVSCEVLPGGEFMCKIKNAVFNWFSIMAQLVILGGTFFVFSSAGNSIFAQQGTFSILRVLVGMLTVVFFTLIPFHVTIENWFINSNYATSNGLFQVFPYIAYAIGIALLLLQLRMLGSLVLPNKFLQSHRAFRSWLTPGTIHKELNSKRAAAFKTNRLIENALDLHCSPSEQGSSINNQASASSRAMANYMATSMETQAMPGLIWAWKNFFTGKICREEGVWFHTRLLASALSPLLALFVVISTLYWSVEEVNRAFDEAEANAITLDVDGISLLDKKINLAYDPIGALARFFVDNAQRSDAMISIGLGGAFSFLPPLWAMFGYIPSYMFNVMKFRYGLIPSLHGYDFHFLLRKAAVDSTTNVFGMVFWSQLFSVFSAFAVGGTISFVAVWGRSTSLFQSIVAQLVGILTTIVLRIVLLLLAKRALVAVFYRKRVAPANIFFVLLECWNIALTAGFLAARAGIFLLLSIFYIGRIDTPFFAHGVDRIELLPHIPLDTAPAFYQQDLLMHEAHRHPYIDRLASLYLLKLKLGDSFGTRAGSAWRLLFSLSLMPWLQMHAVNGTDDAMKGSSGFHHASSEAVGRSIATSKLQILEAEVTKLRIENQRLQSQLKKKKQGEEKEEEEEVGGDVKSQPGARQAAGPGLRKSNLRKSEQKEVTGCGFSNEVDVDDVLPLHQVQPPRTQEMSERESLQRREAPENLEEDATNKMENLAYGFEIDI